MQYNTDDYFLFGLVDWIKIGIHVGTILYNLLYKCVSSSGFFKRKNLDPEIEDTSEK